ncbi:MAG: hypothetical protein HYV38_01940 [Candidatus Levybacteria bacterium]|nr:hypothetical protein [Candidatus Levybacteria bacterium]
MEEKKVSPKVEETPVVAPPSPTLPERRVEEMPAKKSSKFKFFIIGLILLILLFFIGGFAYYFKSMNKIQENSTPESVKEEVIPTPQKPQPKDSGIEMGENTVSFTRVDGDVYLRFGEDVYKPGEDAVELVEKFATESATWYGLVDAPEDIDEKVFNDVLSIKVFPDGNNFLFVTRFTVDDKWVLTAYSYDAYKDSNKVNELFSFENGGKEKYPVPIVSEISGDGKYATFSMFSCWNCGGHIPETLVINLESGDFERIGKTSEFKWKEGGAYDYKEYKETDCELEGPGICPADPDVPLKTGKI